MERIETGRATLKIDEVSNKKYWRVYFNDDKEGEDLNEAEAVEFSPDNFEDGCIIRIFENVDFDK